MNSSDYHNQLLAEFDQIAKLIPILSEKEFDLVIQRLGKRSDEILDILDRPTSPTYRTLKQIIAEKTGRFCERQSRH